MDINIITSTDRCLEFLTFFQLPKKYQAHINYQDRDISKEFTKNRFGWRSWIEMNQMPSLKSYGRDPYQPILKTNIFQANMFIKNHDDLSFEEYQSAFFHKIEDEYQIESRQDKLDVARSLKVNESAFGISLNFIYQPLGERLIVRDVDLKDSYEQLKIISALFEDSYSPSLLYLVPHYDPYAENEVANIEEQLDLENAQFEDFDGWAELGEDEEWSMDQETDGAWRWDTQ